MSDFSGRIPRASFLLNHSMVCLLGAIIEMMDGKIIGMSWFLQEFQLSVGWLGFKNILMIDKLRKRGHILVNGCPLCLADEEC